MGKPKDQPRPRVSIANYFEGATIHNMVINGTMNRNGDEHYYANETKAPMVENGYTDEVIDRAITALNGKDKPLCEKQLFLGIIKVLMSKCGWSGKWATSCERINALPTAQAWDVPCDVINLRAPSALKFASVDYQEWETYEPTEGEREVFRKNRNVSHLFDLELEKQLMQMTEP